MYELKKLHPIHVADLIRIGRNLDGGYVLSAGQIEKTEILLSFGICDDRSFEVDFCKTAHRLRKKSKPLKKVQLHAFDYSTDPSRFLRWSFESFHKIVSSALAYNMLRMKKHSLRVERFFRAFISFPLFFRKKSRHYFYPKFLGTKDDNLYISPETVFKNLPEAPENLNGGLIPGVGLPSVLEITFINKAMGLDSSKRSSRQYPVEGLDFPNMQGQADIPLDFGKP